MCNLTSIFCVQSSMMKWPLLFSANWMLYFCSNDFSICLVLSKYWFGCFLFTKVNGCNERFGVNFLSISSSLYDCHFRTLMSLQNMKIIFSFSKIWFTLTLILKYYHILSEQNFIFYGRHLVVTSFLIWEMTTLLISVCVVLLCILTISKAIFL